VTNGSIQRLVLAAFFFVAAAALPACAQTTENEDSGAGMAENGKSKRRAPPPEVKPVVIAGVRYESLPWGKSRGLGQNGGYLRAVDVDSGEELWILEVYDVSYDGDMEDDKQDRFITKIRKYGKNRLKIYSERCGIYAVNTESRDVTTMREPPC
jgi:hypothetical protein